MNGRIALVMVLLMVCPVGESLCASHSKSRSSVSTSSKARSSASSSSKSKSQTSSREKTSSKSSSGEKSSAKSGDSRGKSRAQKSGSSREDSSEKSSSRKSAKSDDSKNSRSSRKSSSREKDEKDKEERSRASRSERSKKDDDGDTKKKTKTASSSRTSREKERTVASKDKEKSADKDSKEKDSEERSTARHDSAEKKAVAEAADEEKHSKPAKDTAEKKPAGTPSVPGSTDKKAVVAAPNTVPASPAPTAPPTPPATTAQATPAQEYHVLPGIRPGVQPATLASLSAPAASTPRPMPVYTPAPPARTPSATAASWATYKEKQSGGILISNALALPMRKYQPPTASLPSLPSSPASGVIANVNYSPISSFNSDYKTRSANAAIPGQLHGKGWDGKDVPIGIENLYRKILPKDYMPTDLTLMAKEHSFSGQPTYLRREAAESMTRMFNDASRQGLHLQVLSGYRDFGHQMRLYLSAIRRKGSDQHSVAKPGSSEHMLGTTADVTNGEEHLLKRSFANTPEGRWLEANAHRYGWKATVRSSGGSHVDEPWHLRYVGTDAASADHPEDKQGRLSAMGHTIAKPFTSIKNALTRR